MKFRLGELFAGPGGIALGAANAKVGGNSKFRIEHAWAVDNDEDSCQTYQSNICSAEPETVICADVRELDFSNLGPLGEIDAFAFGFPCNDFSLVGEHKGINGSYGPLFSYGVKVLEQFQPKWFVAENVGGLRSANGGITFQIILKQFQDAGYRIYPHLYRFENYGVPQTRHRILIVGIRSDLDVEFHIPAPLHGEPKTCSAAIENPLITSDSPNHDFTKQSSQVIERLKHIKPGQNAFNAEIPEGLRLNVKAAKISQIYKRLDPDKPAYTVTGSGGGGTHIYHWSENRALTNRERARLQTFPDSFVFKGSKESVRKQIGMALPPGGAQVVIEAILKSFAGVHYPSIDPNIVPKPNIIPIS